MYNNVLLHSHGCDEAIVTNSLYIHIIILYICILYFNQFNEVQNQSF